ncbi:hypothetical protein BCD_1467 (plasmid) [Borrelia crocidurae DOU]|uniref:Uncharacterized protein n=1 Tax=Borrelia crocidurae DOU TaxID=1293575 RepID=W5SLH1_9SPIR|nr:hypothetical protein BCD_1467 [Borrelia crocidurae DOU]
MQYCMCYISHILASLKDKLKSKKKQGGEENE